MTYLSHAEMQALGEMLERLADLENTMRLILEGPLHDVPLNEAAHRLIERSRERENGGTAEQDEPQWDWDHPLTLRPDSAGEE